MIILLPTWCLNDLYYGRKLPGQFSRIHGEYGVCHYVHILDDSNINVNSLQYWKLFTARWLEVHLSYRYFGIRGKFPPLTPTAQENKTNHNSKTITSLSLILLRGIFSMLTSRFVARSKLPGLFLWYRGVHKHCLNETGFSYCISKHFIADCDYFISHLMSEWLLYGRTHPGLS